jgi:alpha-beta hydrolase superfamily lysophospholipase
VKRGRSNNETKPALLKSKPKLARSDHPLLLNASVLIALALCAAVTFAQQSAVGANLFAPSVQAGKEIDAERALPTTLFYRPPTSGTTAKPGTLVRAEPATDFVLPPGIRATRILYHTRTASSEDALTSGVVLVPYGQAPKDGWPLLAWSHGTSGVANNCAPSLMKSLFYNWEGLYEYVMLGYAVVATDYAGLGVEGRHAYLDMLSNATDVVNSVPAAHAAVPHLSQKWLVVGHSQGGLASLGVAELEAEIQDPNFLGTVALAGASDLQDSIQGVLKARAPVLNGLIAFWVYGVKTVYPELNLNDVLSNRALSIYDASVENGCSAASGAFAAIPTEEILQPDWSDNRYIKQFLARDRPGAQSVFGPLLLVGGGDDPLFTESAGQKIFQRLCAAGAQIQRKIYPGLSHDPVVYGSFRDQMDWIGARFAGSPGPSDCSSR